MCRWDFKLIKTWIALSSALASLGFTVKSVASPTLQLFAEPLYWQASEQTASIWASQVSVPGNNELRFSPNNMGFDWQPGIKLGMALSPETPGWDGSVFWTHYSTKSSDNVSSAFQIIMPEFFSGFTSGNLFFGSNIDWQLVMNTINLNTGHSYAVTDHLTLRPTAGILGASIDQTINSVWNALFFESTERVTHQFSGIGPDFGLSALWNITGHWNLTGRIDGALLWGRWDVQDTYVRPNAPGVGVTATTITTRINDSQLGTLMLDSFAGLTWQRPSMHTITLQLGYEMQYWANQLRLTAFQQLPTRGDLTLQGATCGLFIDL